MKRTRAQRAFDIWCDLPPPVRIMGVITVLVTVTMLAGCGGTLPVVPGRTAIPVECKEPIPQEPAMPTANLTPESSLDASVQAMQAEIALRDGYEDELVTALKACTKPVKGATP